MNEFIEELFKEDIINKEEILWVGQPTKCKIFSMSDFILIPFSIIVFLFSCIWEIIAIIGTTEDGILEWIFPIMGIPFIMIGMFFLFGRFIYKFKLLKHTYYAITNNRILIITNLFRRCIQAKGLKDIKNIHKSNYRNGRGMICFGTPSLYMKLYVNTGLDFLGGFYSEDTLFFNELGDVDKVYKLLNELIYQNKV